MQFQFQNLDIYFGCTWSNHMLMKESCSIAADLLFSFAWYKMQYWIDDHGLHFSCSQCPKFVQSILAFIIQQNVTILVLILLMDVQIFLLGMVNFQQNLLLVHLFLLVWNLLSPFICFFSWHLSFTICLWASHFKKLIIYFLVEILAKWVALYFKRKQVQNTSLLH